MNEKLDFFELAKILYDSFQKKWDGDYTLLEESNQQLKKALQGNHEAEKYFKNKIELFLRENKIGDVDYPRYYENLIDGLYHQNWGMAGLKEWFTEEYKESSSAKIIGDRIYFLVDGETKLMPQKIDSERLSQLIAKLLSIKPDERKDKDVNEIYLMDGTRVTIYNGTISKPGQIQIVFRRYIVPEYTFEEQAKRNTIPKEAIGLFKSMIQLGYNIAITGAVRTSKSTFLATWQSYENPKLEGMLIETDPEIPLHKLMPTAPIMQIIADDDKLRNIIKNVLRSDSDYIVMGEARNGVALDAAIRIMNKGTRRCKLTFHNRFPHNFTRDAASEIIITEGGDIALIEEKIAQSIDYIFHFIQLSDKSKKRLEGIYELTFDNKSGSIITTQLCKYVEDIDSWVWNSHISSDQEIEGKKENRQEFENFKKQLLVLEQDFSMSPEEKEKATYMRKCRGEIV